MKKRIFTLFLAAALAMTVMTGCQAGNSAGATQSSMAVTTALPGNPMLRPEDAERIALEHAGLTVDQITALRTEYEIDDGVPLYDVDFRYDRWEYDYEINANSGQILSYSKDD